MEPESKKQGPGRGCHIERPGWHGWCGGAGTLEENFPNGLTRVAVVQTVERMEEASGGVRVRVCVIV